MFCQGTGQLWLYLLASQGYCVVAIDSRGSHHRGVQFESHIRRRMVNQIMINISTFYFCSHQFENDFANYREK